MPADAKGLARRPSDHNFGGWKRGIRGQELLVAVTVKIGTIRRAAVWIDFKAYRIEASRLKAQCQPAAACK